MNERTRIKIDWLKGEGQEWKEKEKIERRRKILNEQDKNERRRKRMEWEGKDSKEKDKNERRRMKGEEEY